MLPHASAASMTPSGATIDIQATIGSAMRAATRARAVTAMVVEAIGIELDKR